MHVLLLVDGSHLSVDSEESCSCCAVDVSGVGLSCCDVEVVECGMDSTTMLYEYAQEIALAEAGIPDPTVYE